MNFQVIKQERGYVNFLIIFLLFLVPVVFVTYMELGQTHLKSSQHFKETKRIENQGKSMTRFSSESTIIDVDNLFFNRVDSYNGSSNQYLISINTSPMDTKMLNPSSIEPVPFFYDTYYDFSAYDFYYDAQITADVQGYTFILENPCTESSGSTHCREFEMVTISTHLKKILDVSKKIATYHFTLVTESDGTTTTYYDGVDIVETR